MRLYIFLSIFIASVIIVQCSHTFMGTNVFRQRVHKRLAIFNPKPLKKRVEFFNYTIPQSLGFGRSIKGILAYDLTNSGASANVTAGGVGYPFVTLRMKSDRGRKLKYDIHIYA